MPKKTSEQWIAEANAKYGDRYDYSNSVYTGSNNKLTVICKKHGPFQTIAGKQLHGNKARELGVLIVARKDCR